MDAMAKKEANGQFDYKRIYRSLFDNAYWRPVANTKIMLVFSFLLLFNLIQRVLSIKDAEVPHNFNEKAC